MKTFIAHIGYGIAYDGQDNDWVPSAVLAEGSPAVGPHGVEAWLNAAEDVLQKVLDEAPEVSRIALWDSEEVRAEKQEAFHAATEWWEKTGWPMIDDLLGQVSVPGVAATGTGGWDTTLEYEITIDEKEGK